MRQNECGSSQPCLLRRSFLQGVGTVTLGELFAGRVLAQDASLTASVAGVPENRICNLDDLKIDIPVEFDLFPGELHGRCVLIKLGQKAGGGIGPEQDIVAYSGYCTHMGGELFAGYMKDHKLIGCGEHLTTFDLTRHGMVVAGHATTNLPQVVLELRGSQVFAIGVVGLLYGHSINPPVGEE